MDDYSRFTPKSEGDRLFEEKRRREIERINRSTSYSREDAWLRQMHRDYAGYSSSFH